jgi:hypothetical protein
MWSRATSVTGVRAGATRGAPGKFNERGANFRLSQISMRASEYFPRQER